MKVYGPYSRKDGRKHVILIDSSGKRRTVSYPRYLMEQKLGRQLTDDETVDHKDGDFTNDSPDNLRIKSRVDNAKLGAKRLRIQTFKCPTCGKDVIKSGKQLRWVIQRARKGKAGPFCNRRCAGRYGSDVQNNLTSPKDPSLKKVEYYKEQTFQPLWEG
jgi:hypothetical protein